MSTNRIWMFSTIILLSIAVASVGVAKSRMEEPRTVVLARSSGTAFRPYASGQRPDQGGSAQDSITALIQNDSEHPIPVVQASSDQRWDYLYFENFKEAFEFFHVQADGSRASKENLLKQLGHRGWRLIPGYGTALIFEKPK